MEQSIVQNKPNGFTEYFTEKLAECVARGIVEKSIRNTHRRESTDHDNDECDDRKPP